MDTFVCEACHKTCEVSDPRYVVKIEVFHAAGDLTIDVEELLKTDYRAKIRDLLKEMERSDPEELQDDVYRRFTYTLCRDCQRLYLSDPLRGLR